MSPRESNSDQMKCQLQGSTAVSQASGAARAFGEAQRLTDDSRARLCIVIEELIANLYEHGQG
jgi:anti-sigma regulatory factor (Ser/Thr protein kinase)